MKRIAVVKTVNLGNDETTKVLGVPFEELLRKNDISNRIVIAVEGNDLKVATLNHLIAADEDMFDKTDISELFVVIMDDSFKKLLSALTNEHGEFFEDIIENSNNRSIFNPVVKEMSFNDFVLTEGKEYQVIIHDNKVDSIKRIESDEEEQEEESSSDASMFEQLLSPVIDEQAKSKADSTIEKVKSFSNGDKNLEKFILSSLISSDEKTITLLKEYHDSL